MSPRQITVHIVDNNAGQKCDARCGTDWSRDESQSEARKTLQSRFGDRVGLAFVDLARDAGAGIPRDVLRRISSGDIALPVLLIDGELRITGYFDMRMAADVIEAELEMQRE